MIDLAAGSGSSPFSADSIVVAGTTLGATTESQSISGSVKIDIQGTVLVAGAFSVKTESAEVLDGATLDVAVAATVRTISVSGAHLFVGTGAAFATNNAGAITGFDTTSATGFEVSGASLDIVTVSETAGEMRSWSAVAANVGSMAARGLPSDITLDVRSLDVKVNRADKATGTKLDWSAVTGVTALPTSIESIGATDDLSVGGTVAINLKDTVLGVGTFDVSRRSGLTIDDGALKLSGASELVVSLSGVSLFVGTGGALSTTAGVTTIPPRGPGSRRPTQASTSRSCGRGLTGGSAWPATWGR